ncbi:hypothetical protein HPB48_015633 [Haemaphysalis longicornis]|uniref:Uncharacterized protein n=1 Tax=Haemaphysalis longicornis TaxID=44386 RepID=A0A9J6FHG2_HAELO|nr:hypothetical protein HPB48_015633 [Haemaphysalis longicornis]
MGCRTIFLARITQVLPGVYIGNFRDSKDPEQLQANNITHIISIHDTARKLHEVRAIAAIAWEPFTPAGALKAVLITTRALFSVPVKGQGRITRLFGKLAKQRSWRLRGHRYRVPAEGNAESRNGNLSAPPLPQKYRLKEVGFTVTLDALILTERGIKF